MPPPDTHSLYGIRRPKSTASTKDLSSSATLAFSTHLSSLISRPSSSASQTAESGTSTATTRARPRPSKSKTDIFSTHNRGALKRAAKDISDGNDHVLAQVHKRGEDIGFVDDATLHRAKRKMEQKVKLYEDLKKGEYLAASSDEGEDEQEEDSRARNGDGGGSRLSAARQAEGNSLVDFDRKWAQEEARKRKSRRPGSPDFQDEEEEEDGGDDDGANNDALLVEYEDEFGRTRSGTRAEAAEAARLRATAPPPRHEQDPSEDNNNLELSRASHLPSTARPSRPSNLIYGETIQSSAFNPDAPTSAKMSHLASRRDRTPTPPPETHYDADAEVRNRGTGFYAFSKDEEERRREMEELMGARKGTELARGGVGEKKRERERRVEERRKRVEELRGKRRAEEFLRGLGDLGGLD
ncbi:hypothetical protein AJ80_00906 [Polytolypa hystricis UAMH7299]|uniref:Uncharacterized protein n=1 Tax=Polytolypa hystricis (strain UAMH7299) TaxID=1447883 RepID=A0A2B7Z2S9_POLH7|nr:hypothetical protein AJ80_00906 [Polytolypa hystricis UAMH7299]